MLLKIMPKMRKRMRCSKNQSKEIKKSVICRENFVFVEIIDVCICSNVEIYKFVKAHISRLFRITHIFQCNSHDC